MGWMNENYKDRFSRDNVLQILLEELYEKIKRMIMTPKTFFFFSGSIPKKPA